MATNKDFKVKNGVNAQAFNSFSTPTEFQAAGGMVMAYNGTGLGVLRAYSNSSGGAGTILFTNNAGSETVRITTTGAVGIGTTSPQANLVISNAGAAGLEIAASGGINGGPTISAYNRSTAAYIPIISYAQMHSWWTLNFGRSMDLDVNGNLGVGTTTPLSKLDSTVVDTGTTTSPISVSLTHKTSGTAAAGFGSTLQYTLQDAGGSLINTNSISSIWTNAAAATRSAALVFFAGNANVQTEAMRINAAGLVGVGTSNPSSLLSSSNNTITVEGVAGADISLRRAGGTANIAIGVTSADVGYILSNTNTSIIFGFGGLEKMRLDTNGNFGVGTGAPTNFGAGYRTIAINGASGSVLEFVLNGATFGTVTADSANLRITTPGATAIAFVTNATEKMRVDSNGNFGIGTNAPLYKLHVVGNSTYPTAIWDTNASSVPAITQYRVNASAGWEIGMAQIADNYKYMMCYGTFGTTNAKFALTNSGFMGLGGNTTGISGGVQHQLAINYAGGSTTYGLALKQATNTTVAVNFVSNTDSIIGSITTTATSTAYNTTSDSRLKKNVEPAESFGQVIDSINVVSFDWKIDDSHQRAGFIAQDLHEVLPEAVRVGDSNNEVSDPWSVDPSKIVPMLIKEIQELRARVKALENK